MGIFGSIVKGTAKNAKGVSMAPVKALRRIMRTAWDTVMSIPTRVGRVVTLGRFGSVTTPLVGVAVIIASLTYVGVV